MGGYREWPVHPALADRCVCTWVDQSAGAPQAVLPDACIDLVFDGQELRVVGPDTRPVPIVAAATYAGIRFRPGAAPAVLGVSAEELRDRSVPLAEVWGRHGRALEERLLADPGQARETLEQALLPRPASTDGLVRGLLEVVSGEAVRDLRVDTLAQRLQVSDRNLRRRCTSAFGYGPKTLLRVLRFRRALRMLQAGWTPAEVAASLGFSDQAHLNFELRRLGGVCPSEVGRRDILLSTNGVD